MGRITIEDCTKKVFNRFGLGFSVTNFNNKEVKGVDVKLIGDIEDTDIILIGNTFAESEEVHDTNNNFIDVTINDNFDNILLERE